MKYLVSILLYSLTVPLAAQQANNWYFGTQAGLSFNAEQPVVHTNGKMSSWEGGSSISDINGNLLFYTDGITVWDSTHNVMPNGARMKGSKSSTQSTIIIPKPFNSGVFYIFCSQSSEDYIKGQGGLYISEIDMSLNSGKGDIVQGRKSLLLTSPVSEKLSAVYHANRRDIWVLAYKLNSDSVLAYLVTEKGISDIPVKSNTGVFLRGGSEQGTIGQMKISPNGEKIACANFSNASVPNFVADFNTSTGMVSNVLRFPGHHSYGLEFSRNSRLLYISEFYPKRVLQYNAYARSVQALTSSEQIVASGFKNEVSSMQLGPDMRIYVSEDLSNFIHVIHAPDSVGSKCKFQRGFLYLGGRRCLEGLPNFISTYLNPSISRVNADLPNFEIYPNPNSGSFTIFSKVPGEKMLALVYDGAGRLVFESTFDQSFYSVDLKLATGVYTVVLRRSEVQEISRIVVVND